MIEVLKPGLETCVQDYPGRKGAFGMGFPPSGPIDHWSFRLANILVGNEPGAAALECQFIGPALKFTTSAVVSLCGSDMAATLDGALVPLWQSVAVSAGQVLELGSAINGARAYLAIAGGIDTPPFLGSRATFVLGECGGLNGAPLKAGSEIPVGAGDGAYAVEADGFALVNVGVSIAIEGGYGASFIYNPDSETPYFVVSKSW
mgnify:CR=1 FL=1